MRACQLGAHTRSAEMVDRLAEAALGVSAVGEQGPGTRLDAERPCGSCRLCLGGQPVQGVLREVGPAASRGGLDQLAQTPVLGDDLSMLAGGRRGSQGLLIPAKAVAEDS